MGKIKMRIRKKLDFNKDSKVNFKDFIDKLEDIVDTDDDGHVDTDELINAVGKSVNLIETIKSGV